MASDDSRSRAAGYARYDASEIISRSPSALQLRYLQMLTESGVNQNATVVFPLPPRSCAASGGGASLGGRAEGPRQGASEG